MFKLLTISTITFITLTKVSGQKVIKFDTLRYVYKIDKYCNSVKASKKYKKLLGCGDNISTSTTSKLNKDFSESEILWCSTTIYDSLGNIYGKNFFYKNHKLIRAIMTFANSDTRKNYEAKYYFDNSNLVYVFGETSRKYTITEITASSSNDSFCIPNSIY
jgi:hypothetical protein